MDIAIRQWTEADLPIADDIQRVAFGITESRAAELARYFALQPDGWFLAAIDGAPVGTVGAVDYGSFAYIGMMCVRPEFQRCGVGHALMQRLLAGLDARGAPMALLDATQAGARVYVHFGFVEDDLAYVFERRSDARSWGRPDGVHLLQRQDVQAIADFDAPIFGGNRALVFHALLADFPGRAFLIRDEAGQVSGYLFAQSQRIGPWIAKRPQDAETLLQAALSLPYEGAPIAIAPRMNAAAIELLEQFGFQYARSCRHMRRGGSHMPAQRTLIYAQTSFAIG
jgi:GNAT superfamily N-acetyltransferase